MADKTDWDALFRNDNFLDFLSKNNIRHSGYFCDSEARDECWVFKNISGTEVRDVGTDHVFNDNDDDIDVVKVERWLERLHKLMGERGWKEG